MIWQFAAERGLFYFPSVPSPSRFIASQQSLVRIHLQSLNPDLCFYCHNEVSHIDMEKVFIRTGSVALNKGIISRRLAVRCQGSI
jgi:hypothetical protein